jgi:NAD-dependent dihydropyrimidine dehydrogenase PreA subunit
MVVIIETCIDCKLWHNYCPVKAISSDGDGRSGVDFDACVECGTCYRAKVCPMDSIEYPKLSYPRTLRRHFSDPTSRHEITGMPGRGTEEIKTNDVTDRFKFGQVGFCIEIGRPGVGTSIAEVEKISKVLTAFGIELEERNPVYPMISNHETGEFKEELLGERVLSIIIELIVPEEKAPSLLTEIKELSGNVDTAFSISLAGRINEDGSIPIKEMLDGLKITYRPNAKINLGLGTLPEASP